jgi:hypothetical protein
MLNVTGFIVGKTQTVAAQLSHSEFRSHGQGLAGYLGLIAHELTERRRNQLGINRKVEELLPSRD